MKLKDGLTKRQLKKRNLSKGTTPGIDKVLRCRKHPLKTLLAKDNRLYRTNPKLYQEAINYINSQG